jgi:Holliday junction resolvase-like predicted endonuclease
VSIGILTLISLLYISPSISCVADASPNAQDVAITNTVLQTVLLRETRQNPVCRIREIALRSKICPSVVKGLLAKLKEAGIVTLTGEEIRVTLEQRVRIAELAISSGADPEKVARELRWQEFEALAAQILNREGYVTVNHFIFKHVARKYEIDVLAAKDSIVLCVDCKHWHHGWAQSRIMTAATNQFLRVQSLSEVFAFYEKRHHVANGQSLWLLPIVLTLADVSSRLVDGVPIVSALRFKDFLCQVSPWDEKLRFIDVPARSQAFLLS